MSTGLQRAERVHRRRGWLIPTALLAAFAPKCVLCLLGYAGIGIALGLAGPEICGEPGGAAGLWAIGLPALALVAGAAGILFRCCHRAR